MRARSRVWMPSYLCAAAILFAAQSAAASETAGQHYPVGVNTLGNALLPIPGMLSLYNYGQIISADELKDDDGNSLIPNFKSSAQLDAARFLYTLKQPIGPFHAVVGVVPTLVHARLRPGTPSAQNSTAFADLTVETYLSYASADHKLFAFFGLDTFVPTGPYERERLLNIGKNYWGFFPSASVTYMPTRNWEISATAGAEFSTTNPATSYHSGTTLNLDYGVSWKPDATSPWGVGIGGYAAQQVQDDTVRGVSVPGGRRDREFGVGPQIRYDWAFGGMAVKYQKMFAVRDRPEGSRLWIEFAVPLAGKPRAR